MGKPEFSEEWQNKEVTVSRREFGDVIVREIDAVLKAVARASGNDELVIEMFKELLFQFCASIGAELFPDETDTLDIDDV